MSSLTTFLRVVRPTKRSRVGLLMPRPTTVPDRWWIDEVWWTTDAKTVAVAYERWPFNHGWRHERTFAPSDPIRHHG